MAACTRILNSLRAVKILWPAIPVATARSAPASTHAAFMPKFVPALLGLASHFALTPRGPLIQTVGPRLSKTATKYLLCCSSARPSPPERLHTAAGARSTASRPMYLIAGQTRQSDSRGTMPCRYRAAGCPDQRKKKKKKNSAQAMNGNVSGLSLWQTCVSGSAAPIPISEAARIGSALREAAPQEWARPAVRLVHFRA